MLTTEDRLDILDLLARYNYAIDDNDGDAWAACFTEDGVFTSPNGSFTGREALSKFADESKRGGLHLTSNHIITCDGNEVEMRCYLQLVIASGRETRDSLLRAVRGCARQVR